MSIRSDRRLVALATAALLTACFPLVRSADRMAATAPYAISTDQSVYAPGANMMVTIRNSSTDAVTYSVCPLRLERRENDEWAVASRWPALGSICAAMPNTLAAGSSIRTPVSVPLDVTAGTYRLIFEALEGKNGAALASDSRATGTFAVR